MDKYRLDLKYTSAGQPRRVIIRADAASDGEAIRISHALIDLALFEGATSIEVGVTGSHNREIATVSEDEDDRNYLERPIRYGSGYRPEREISS